MFYKLLGDEATSQRNSNHKQQILHAQEESLRLEQSATCLLTPSTMKVLDRKSKFSGWLQDKENRTPKKIRATFP